LASLLLEAAVMVDFKKGALVRIATQTSLGLRGAS
jgi:hypothetical protein